MSFLGGLADKITGGLGGRVMDAVGRHFPPDLSPEQLADIAKDMKIFEAQEKRAGEMAEVAAEERFNQRIKDMEGTASDLKSIAFLGPIILFLRGLQRPVWGFATLIMDFKWFFGAAGNTFTEQQQTALIVINTLVLGFLFGERAIKNLTPLIVQVFGKKEAASG